MEERMFRAPLTATDLIDWQMGRTAAYAEFIESELKALKPQGYSRRRRILELRRAQYRQWRMGWGKPNRRS